MTRRTKKAVVSHYLLSLALDCCAHMHAYLMTDDKRYLARHGGARCCPRRKSSDAIRATG